VMRCCNCCASWGCKKLSQANNNSNTNNITGATGINLIFFDTLAIKMNNIVFSRANLPQLVNNYYTNLLIKNEAFCQFKFLLLNQFKIVSFFI
jgi:hypothetical protein